MHMKITAMEILKGKSNVSYINGEWVPAASGRTFEVRNPATSEVIATVPDMDDKDTEKAIEAASQVTKSL